MATETTQILRSPNSPSGLQPRRCGFTLLELLVVAVLTTMLSMLTAQLWRHFSRQSADLRNRAQAANELLLAVRNLADDMGRVDTVTPLGETMLIGRQKPSGTGSEVVEYSVVGQKLLRTEHDDDGGTSVPVADHVTSLVCEQATGSLTRIILTVTCGGISRNCTLYWSKT